MAKHSKQPDEQVAQVPQMDAAQPRSFVTLNVAFVAMTLLLLLVPLVGMPFVSSDVSAEKRELTPWPQLTTDEGVNTAFLSEAGAAFEDRFALRSQLVDLDATIKERVFGTSSTDNVLVGKQGWIYYAGSLQNFQRVNQMSDQSLRNAAINLSLMQEYVEGMGKTFTFTVCPNKNELYPQYMPYYLPAGEGPSSLERLELLLDELGVHYVNLREELSAHDEVLYYERDSHWNNAGALVGYNALLDAAGRTHETYADVEPTMDDEHLGDIEAMLHPSNGRIEKGPLWHDSERFHYANEATSVEDAFIQTASDREGATGNLLMYRDSFGNALLPYLATEYRAGVFTKRIPYDMGTAAVGWADDVIVERTERHLAFYASDPPYMPAIERSGVDADTTHFTGTTLVATTNGPYLMLEGTLDRLYVREDSRCLLRLTYADGSEHTYEAFRVSPPADESQDSEGPANEGNSAVTSEYGYRAYIVSAEGAERAEVLVSDDRGIARVLDTALQVEG